MECDGIKYIKDDNIHLFHIECITEELKNIIREYLSAICHGIDNANNPKGRKGIFSYKRTVKEFITRYENKINSEKLQMGIIGELMAHVLINVYMEKLKIVSPFFNMEERNIRKGIDIISFVDEDNTVWLIEVKSGLVNNKMNAVTKMCERIREAKRCISLQFKDKESAIWNAAINSVRNALNKSIDTQNDIVDILLNYDNEMVRNPSNDLAKNKNVILIGIVFDKEVYDNEALYQKMRKYSKKYSEIFNNVIIISIQKNTYTAVYKFLKGEI